MTRIRQSVLPKPIKKFLGVVVSYCFIRNIRYRNPIIEDNTIAVDHFDSKCSVFIARHLRDHVMSDFYRGSINTRDPLMAKQSTGDRAI